MKLYQKLTSLLVAAVMAAVLMPVCMAAPGDSVETRINNALAQRTGADRKSTRLNSSHRCTSRMPSSA